MAANAARECRRLGARRALLLSSGSIYGGRDGAALTERSGIPPEGDLDAYGRSVQEVEGAFRSGAGAAELVVARLFFPYGPGQRPARLVPRIATRILRGEPVQLRRAADGEEGRPRLNPVFADDAVEAMARLLALSALPSPALAVNVCGPEAVTVRELAIRIARVLRRECHFERAPDGGPPRDLVGDGRLLRELIGFSGGRALSAGLQAALKDLTI